jgi:hypothetical protein
VPKRPLSLRSLRAVSRRRLRASAMGAVLAAVLGWAALGPVPAEAAHGFPGAAAAAPVPGTLCAHTGTLKGRGGQRADVSLCVSTGSRVMTVSAPAICGRAGESVRYTCGTSGSWTVRRAGEAVASGPLPGAAEYPGPATYRVSGAVHVRSTPAGIDLTGDVHGTLTLVEPKQAPTHRIEVDRHVVPANASTTLTYTVARDSEQGDGSARFGLIGEEASGVELTTADPRCVNPLTGRYPSTKRNMFALDCTPTDLQPGHPSTIVVRVAVKKTCGAVVSKLGYWMPQGQGASAGGMISGPTVTCERSRGR